MPTALTSTSPQAAISASIPKETLPSIIVANMIPTAMAMWTCSTRPLAIGPVGNVLGWMY
jgi:hypothetical protein